MRKKEDSCKKRVDKHTNRYVHIKVSSVLAIIAFLGLGFLSACNFITSIATPMETWYVYGTFISAFVLFGMAFIVPILICEDDKDED